MSSQQQAITTTITDPRADGDYFIIGRAPKALTTADLRSPPSKGPVCSTAENEEKKIDIVSKPNPLATGMSRAVRLYMGKGSVRTASIRARLVDEYLLQSTASGTVAVAYNLYTGLQATSEWGSFVALFREFRIESCRFTYVPYTPSKVESSVNTNGRVICWAVEADNATAPTSVVSLFENETAKVFSNQNPRGSRWTWKNPDERWFSGNSTTNPLQPLTSLKVAGDVNFGVSLPIGAFFIEFFVGLRDRF